jgi:hypothetical protein
MQSSLRRSERSCPLVADVGPAPFHRLCYGFLTYLGIEYGFFRHTSAWLLKEANSRSRPFYYAICEHDVSDFTTHPKTAGYPGTRLVYTL